MCTAGILSSTWGYGDNDDDDLSEPTCVWRRFKCDSHLNCGFKYNSDEAGCPGGAPLPPTAWWSASTMSFLVFVYMGIVLSLILFTMAFLRWHRAYRGMPAAVNEQMYAQAVGRQAPAAGPPPHPPTVSIMVMYRPAQAGGQKTADVGSSELPPSYESLFSQEPPTYVNLPDEAAAAVEDCAGTCVEQQAAAAADCCECDCDHSNCQASQDETQSRS